MNLMKRPTYKLNTLTKRTPSLLLYSDYFHFIASQRKGEKEAFKATGHKNVDIYFQVCNVRIYFCRCSMLLFSTKNTQKVSVIFAAYLFRIYATVAMAMLIAALEKKNTFYSGFFLDFRRRKTDVTWTERV